ncbi:MAG: hypothetical protein EOO40_00225 [Deltaproteobacteria bacterium]|nr:MAG: hypothetical protein EOO40_00225 [Deltaproteobacteria bacterium]
MKNYSISMLHYVAKLSDGNDGSPRRMLVFKDGTVAMADPTGISNVYRLETSTTARKEVGRIAPMLVLHAGLLLFPVNVPSKA